MKNIFVIAALTLIFPGLVSARERSFPQSDNDGGAIRAIAVKGANTEPSLRLAMGPVSAPHVPAGNPNGPASSPSDNPPSPPTHHKKSTHRHKHSGRESALHFIA